jgi:putative ABC transport system substrate-binding protein
MSTMRDASGCPLSRALLAILLSLIILHPGLAQEGAKSRRVAWIAISHEQDVRQQQIDKAIRAAFADLGYHEGKNLVLDMRYAASRIEWGPQLAGEALGAGAEVIVAAGIQLAQATLQVNKTVPVVGVGCGVERLAESLARPGRNFTGVTCQSFDLVAKHVQLLSEVLPEERQVAALVNLDSPTAPNVAEQIKRSAADLKLEVPSVAARNPEEIHTAFGEIAKLGARGAVVAPDAMFWGERRRMVAAAAAHRIAIITSYREATDLGGLLSYGNSMTDLIRRAVVIVDKILQGAKAADLPMEQPTRFELVVNLKTAQQLGLTIPASILLRADDVIE